MLLQLQKHLHFTRIAYLHCWECDLSNVVLHAQAKDTPDLVHGHTPVTHKNDTQRVTHQK